MGEIADAIINGELDITGEYLGAPIGYPRHTSCAKRHRHRNKVRKETKKVTDLCNKYKIGEFEKIRLMNMLLQRMGVRPLPKLRQQYKLIHNLYMTEFETFIRTYEKENYQAFLR